MDFFVETVSVATADRDGGRVKMLAPLALADMRTTQGIESGHVRRPPVDAGVLLTEKK